MEKTIVITLHIRDAVSKTFHITPHEIILHDDIKGEPLLVPEKYREEVMKMVKTAKERADEYTHIVEINASGGSNPEELGDPAEKIWEEVTNR